MGQSFQSLIFCLSLPTLSHHLFLQVRIQKETEDFVHEQMEQFVVLMHTIDLQVGLVNKVIYFQKFDAKDVVDIPIQIFCHPNRCIAPDITD